MIKQLLAMSVVLAATGCGGFGPSKSTKTATIFGLGHSSAGASNLKSGDADTRRWAILQLAERGNLEQTDAIIALLDPANEKSPLVRSTAATGLRILGNPKAIPALEKAVNDPEPLVRLDAVGALGDLGGKEQLPVLARSVKSDSDARVRLQAAIALRKAAGEEAISALIDALNDPDESVSFAAHQGLIALTNKVFPPSSARWREWMKSQ